MGSRKRLAAMFFVEIEEDWEVLHEQVHASDGGGDVQAEEDGDVAIDW